MSSSWKTMTLKEAGVSLIDCDHKTPSAQKNGYPYIAIPQIKNGRIDLTGVRLISREDLLTWTRKAKPQVHDIVLSRRCNPGETAFVPSNLECAIGQNLVLLRSDGEKLYPPFLRWLVRGTEWWNQIEKYLNTGAIFDSLKCADIPKFELSIPPLPTQRRIADIFSALDEKIELNRQTNVTLEVITRSIFREWFVVNEDSEKWQEIDLPEAIDFLEGPGIRNWQYTNSDEGIRFINIRCIQNRDINTETANRINENDVNTKYQHFLLRQDDIVVSTSGTLGRFGIIRNEHLPLLLNTSVIRMRPVEGVTTWSYLIGYIESEEFQFELATRATGSVQKNFGPMHLKQMKIKIPPIELLNEFEKVAEPLHRKMLHNFSESATLASLRDALLPKLMSGEIEITNN